MSDTPLDVWTVNTGYAQRHLSELLEFAREPGHYVRVIHGHSPRRQVWVGGSPPPGWEQMDDTGALVTLVRHRQGAAAAAREARRAKITVEAG